MVNSSDIEETVKNGSINKNNGESNRPACAACKHQRKKCRKGCLFFNYFPSKKQREFTAAHQIFGIANLTKMMKDIVSDKRSQVVDSVVWEAMIWTNKDHQEYGPLGIYRKLEQHNTKLQDEVKRLTENVKECQKQLQQYQKENENVIKYQQQMLQSRGHSQSQSLVSNPSSRTGVFSKTIQSEGFSQQQRPEHLQLMVTQNTMPPTSRIPLENITNIPNVSGIHSSLKRPWGYESYFYQTQPFISEGGFIQQPPFVLSNQLQENNVATLGGLGQQNYTVNTPVQNNITAEQQQMQWTSS